MHNYTDLLEELRVELLEAGTGQFFGEVVAAMQARQLDPRRVGGGPALAI